VGEENIELYRQRVEGVERRGWREKVWRKCERGKKGGM